MAKIKFDYEHGGIKRYRFHCPGCNRTHLINDKVWDFNGDMEKPTIRASVLFRSGHYASNDEGDCWCDYNKTHPDEHKAKCLRCHSYVTDGKIRFLNDCTHELAGQTVELPEID